MWDLARSSIVLFFQGRLFADPAHVLRQLAIGVAIALALLLGLARLGLPVWVATATAAFVGGLIQPWLFRNLKYR
jgi:hypothetical protein